MIFLFILIIVIIAVVLISIYENTHFKIKNYVISDDYFEDDNIRLLFISDLHDCRYGKNNEKLLNEIDRQHPDAVLIGGDVFNGIKNSKNINAKHFIKELSLKYKIIYALGNHEFRFYLYPETYPGYKDEFEGILDDCGVVLLDNSSTGLMIRDKIIDIFGLSIERKYYKRFKNIEMSELYVENALPKRNKNHFSVLLAHNPKYFKEYSNFKADLILSGHYHGGLVRLGRQGVISPTFRLFPKYSYGFIKNDKSKMIVSGGLGIHTIRFRVFNRPELVVIDLKKKG